MTWFSFLMADLFGDLLRGGVVGCTSGCSAHWESYPYRKN